MSDDEQQEGGGSRKKPAKKVYYPFGTPSHVHHAFSEFAHIGVDCRSFAMELATATDIKPEVVEEKPKPKRRPPPIIKKKPAGADDESVGEESHNSEDQQPCTKLPCVAVVRALADMEFKNQVEKMDLEDEYEQHLVDARVMEQELVQSEGRLTKLTDIGNQLEISANQLMAKVETLEKSKETLSSERSEINSKLMLLEVERQKWNRKLEKAQKALADARWKKKKAAMDSIMDVGDGAISLEPSAISEGPIIKCDASAVSSALGTFNTSYSRLVQQNVVDYSELPPTLKIVPDAVQEVFFRKPSGPASTRAGEGGMDKYTKAHYQRAIAGSLQSWEAQAGSLLACSIKAADQALLAHERAMEEENQVELRRLKRLALLQNSLGGSSGAPAAQPLAWSVSAASLASSQGGSQRLAQSAQRSLRSVTSASAAGGGGGGGSVCDSSAAPSRSQALVQSVQFLYERSAKAGLLPAQTRTATNLKLGASRSLSSLTSSSLLLSSSPTGRGPLDGPSSLGSPGGGSLDAPLSVLSLEAEDAQLEQLADSGIYIDVNGRRAPAHSRLDGVFYKDLARAGFGRHVPLGKTFAKPAKVLVEKKEAVPEEEETASQRIMRRTGTGLGKFSSNGSFDLRSLPRLQSQVLTTKHPGMSAFAQAATMSIKEGSVSR